MVPLDFVVLHLVLCCHKGEGEIPHMPFTLTPAFSEVPSQFGLSLLVVTFFKAFRYGRSDVNTFFFYLLNKSHSHLLEKRWGMKQLRSVCQLYLQRLKKIPSKESLSIISVGYMAQSIWGHEWGGTGDNQLSRFKVIILWQGWYVTVTKIPYIGFKNEKEKKQTKNLTPLLQTLSKLTHPDSCVGRLHTNGTFLWERLLATTA